MIEFEILFVQLPPFGVPGGELALEELAEVRGVEIAEWFGLVLGVATDDHEKRVLAPLAPDELDDLPRPLNPTSVWVEQLLCGVDGVEPVLFIPVIELLRELQASLFKLAVESVLFLGRS